MQFQSLIRTRRGTEYVCMTEEELMRRKDASVESQETGLLDDDKQQSRRKNSVPLIVALFLLGAVFGVAMKTTASQSIVVGYWDYTVSPRDISAVDLNAAQKKMLSKIEEEQKQMDAEKDVQPSEENQEEASPIIIQEDSQQQE